MTKLLAYLLHQCEKFPDAKFYESDLIRISSSCFSDLKKQKYLRFDQYDFEQENHVDNRGNERFVRKVNGRWKAISTEHSEISSVYLTEQDLNRYIFDVQPLIYNIKAANNLAKNVNAVRPRIWFLGEATVVRDTVGIFLAFMSDDEVAESELLGLRAKVGRMDGVLVLCPSYTIKSQDLLNKLAGLNISCLSFNDAFKKKNYVIDFGKVRLEQSLRSSTPQLTSKQTADYTKRGYLCYDTLHIPGRAPRKRSNELNINGHNIKMPDEAFKLLMEMVVELKKGKGGWLTKVVEAGKYQIFDRVRTPLQGSLQDKDAKKFIENNASKQYRISTHPDFVTYDRANLLHHSDTTIHALAKRLPK